MPSGPCSESMSENSVATAEYNDYNLKVEVIDRINGSNDYNLLRMFQDYGGTVHEFENQNGPASTERYFENGIVEGSLNSASFGDSSNSLQNIDFIDTYHFGDMSSDDDDILPSPGSSVDATSAFTAAALDSPISSDVALNSPVGSIALSPSHSSTQTANVENFDEDRNREVSRRLDEDLAAEESYTSDFDPCPLSPPVPLQRQKSLLHTSRDGILRKRDPSPESSTEEDAEFGMAPISTQNSYRSPSRSSSSHRSSVSFSNSDTVKTFSSRSSPSKSSSSVAPPQETSVHKKVKLQNRANVVVYVVQPEKKGGNEVHEKSILCLGQEPGVLEHTNPKKLPPEDLCGTYAIGEILNKANLPSNDWVRKYSVDTALFSPGSYSGPCKVEPANLQMLYDTVAQQAVANCILGNDARFNIIGTTSHKSGRTFSMVGESCNTISMKILNTALGHPKVGIIPRVCYNLMEELGLVEARRENQNTVQLTVYEIFGSKVKNLIGNQPWTYHRVRETSKEGSYIDGLKPATVENWEELSSKLCKAFTAYGKESDPFEVGHLVVKLDIKTRGGLAELQMVDLVSQGESDWIRKSNIALKSVLIGLSKGLTGTELPYRESSLTHALKPTLKPGCRVSMLFEVDPSLGAHRTTASYLKYAASVKNPWFEEEEKRSDSQGTNDDASQEMTALIQSIAEKGGPTSRALYREKMSDPQQRIARLTESKSPMSTQSLALKGHHHGRNFSFSEDDNVIESMREDALDEPSNNIQLSQSSPNSVIRSITCPSFRARHLLFHSPQHSRDRNELNNMVGTTSITFSNGCNTPEQQEVVLYIAETQKLLEIEVQNRNDSSMRIREYDINEASPSTLSDQESYLDIVPHSENQILMRNDCIESNPESEENEAYEVSSFIEDKANTTSASTSTMCIKEAIQLTLDPNESFSGVRNNNHDFSVQTSSEVAEISRSELVNTNERNLYIGEVLYENESLRLELAQRIQEIDILTKELYQVKASTQREEQFMVEIAGFRSQEAKHNRDIEELLATIANKDSDKIIEVERRVQLQLEVDRLRFQADKHSNENSSLREELSKLNKELAFSSQRSESEKRHIENLESDMSLLISEKEKLQEKLSTSSYQCDRTQYSDYLDDEVKNLRCDADKRELYVTDLTDNLHQKEIELVNAQQELIEKVQENEKYHQEINEFNEKEEKIVLEFSNKLLEKDAELDKLKHSDARIRQILACWETRSFSNISLDQRFDPSFNDTEQLDTFELAKQLIDALDEKNAKLSELNCSIAMSTNCVTGDYRSSEGNTEMLMMALEDSTVQISNLTEKLFEHEKTSKLTNDNLITELARVRSEMAVLQSQFQPIDASCAPEMIRNELEYTTSENDDFVLNDHSESILLGESLVSQPVYSESEVKSHHSAQTDEMILSLIESPIRSTPGFEETSRSEESNSDDIDELSINLLQVLSNGKTRRLLSQSEIAGMRNHGILVAGTLRRAVQYSIEVERHISHLSKYISRLASESQSSTLQNWIAEVDRLKYNAEFSFTEINRLRSELVTAISESVRYSAETCSLRTEIMRFEGANQDYLSLNEQFRSGLSRLKASESGLVNREEISNLHTLEIERLKSEIEHLTNIHDNDISTIDQLRKVLSDSKVSIPRTELISPEEISRLQVELHSQCGLDNNSSELLIRDLRENPFCSELKNSDLEKSNALEIESLQSEISILGTLVEQKSVEIEKLKNNIFNSQSETTAICRLKDEEIASLRVKVESLEATRIQRSSSIEQLRSDLACAKMQISDLERAKVTASDYFNIQINNFKTIQSQDVVTIEQLKAKILQSETTSSEKNKLSQAEIHRLGKILQDSKDEIESLQNDNSSLKNDMFELKLRNNELQNIKIQNLAIISRLQVDSSSSSEVNIKYESIIKQLHDECSRAKIELHAALDTIGQYISKVESLENELRTVSENGVLERAALRKGELEIERLGDYTSCLKLEVNTTAKKNVGYEHTIAALNEEVKGLNDRLKILHDSNLATIQQLEKELLNSNEESARYIIEVEQLREEITKTKRDLIESEESNTYNASLTVKLQKQIQEEKEQNEQAKKDVQENTAEIEGLKDQLSTAKMDISDAKKKNNEYFTVICELKDNVSTLQDQRQQVVIENERLQDELFISKSKISKAFNNAIEIDDLKAALENSKNQCMIHRTEIENLTKELVEAESKLTREVEKSNSQAGLILYSQDSNCQLDLEIKRLREEFSIAKSELKALLEKHDTKDSTIKDLLQKITVLENSSEDKFVEIDGLRQDTIKLKMDLERSEMEIRRISRENQKYILETRQLSKDALDSKIDAQTTKAELARIQGECQHAISENEQLSSQLSSSKLKLKNAQITIKNISISLTSKEAEIDSLTTKINTYDLKVRQLEKNLKEMSDRYSRDMTTVEALRQELDASEIEKEITASDLRKALKEKEELKEHLNDMQVALTNAADNMNIENCNAYKLYEKEENLARCLEEDRKKIKMMESQNASLRREVSKTVNLLNETRESKQLLVDELRILRLDLEVSDTKLRRANGENSRLNDKLLENSAQLATIESTKVINGCMLRESSDKIAPYEQSDLSTRSASSKGLDFFTNLKSESHQRGNTAPKTPSKKTIDDASYGTSGGSQRTMVTPKTPSKDTGDVSRWRTGGHQQGRISSCINESESSDSSVPTDTYSRRFQSMNYGNNKPVVNKSNNKGKCESCKKDETMGFCETCGKKLKVKRENDVVENLTMPEFVRNPIYFNIQTQQETHGNDKSKELQQPSYHISRDQLRRPGAKRG